MVAHSAAGEGKSCVLQALGELLSDWRYIPCFFKSWNIFKNPFSYKVYSLYYLIACIYITDLFKLPTEEIWLYVETTI